MKKAIVLCVICALCTHGTYALSARSAVVYDCLSESFVFEQNSTEPRLFASTTKIMTALLALELYDMDEEVIVHPEWCGIEGSSIYLVPGEKITIRALVYGLLLTSGNDAAVALASLHTGNVEDFVLGMNERAAEIGAFDTHFENPNGLDGDGHKTTARDLAKIAACALLNAEFREIVSSESAKIDGRYFTNHNKLLKMNSEIIGVKTGFTKAAGRCLVSAIDRGGRVFVAVTLNAPNDWDDHMEMYRANVPQMESTEAVGVDMFVSVPVVGTGGVVKARAAQGITLGLSTAEKEQMHVYVIGGRFAYAPIKKGDVYGEICVKIGDKKVASLPLYYESDIAMKNEKMGWAQKIWERICGE